MTKKDFIVLARTIRITLEEIHQAEKMGIITPSEALKQEAGISKLRTNLVIALQQLNPRFDEYKFRSFSLPLVK